MSIPSVQINVGGQPVSAEALEGLAARQAPVAAAPAAPAAPLFCVVTLHRAGKDSKTIEVEQGTKVSECLRLVGFDTTNMTFKKQTDGGAIADVKGDSTLTGASSFNVWASPKVVGGSRK